MRNLPVASRLALQNWISKEISNKYLIFFRIAFSSIWLTYDLIDFSKSETLKFIWFYRLPVRSNIVVSLQVLLILFEFGLLLGWHPRKMSFGAFLSRAFLSYFVTLNDFFYFSIVALILSVCDTEGWPNKPKQIAGWPRDILVLQTAWIYFSSSILKMNPSFLNGSDLFVRQNYELAILPMYYPAFFRSFLSTLWGNSILSWAAVLMEGGLAIALFTWLIFPRFRKFSRLLALLLATGIHGYAAYTLNVFFFGASMIVQVAFLTKE